MLACCHHLTFHWHRFEFFCDWSVPELNTWRNSNEVGFMLREARAIRKCACPKMVLFKLFISLFLIKYHLDQTDYFNENCISNFNSPKSKESFQWSDGYHLKSSPQKKVKTTSSRQNRVKYMILHQAFDNFFLTLVLKSVFAQEGISKQM